MLSEKISLDVQQYDKTPVLQIKFYPGPLSLSRLPMLSQLLTVFVGLVLLLQNLFKGTRNIVGTVCVRTRLEPGIFLIKNRKNSQYTVALNKTEFLRIRLTKKRTGNKIQKIILRHFSCHISDIYV
jgi:hypothetical protein